jgi:hypothetical protein
VYIPPNQHKKPTLTSELESGQAVASLLVAIRSETLDAHIRAVRRYYIVVRGESRGVLCRQRSWPSPVLFAQQRHPELFVHCTGSCLSLVRDGIIRWELPLPHARARRASPALDRCHAESHSLRRYCVCLKRNNNASGDVSQVRCRGLHAHSNTVGTKCHQLTSSALGFDDLKLCVS